MTKYGDQVTKVEELVARATDDALVEPEWALNMELCDFIHAHPNVCDDIVRCLQCRLQSGKPKVTLLALILTETVVKNGPRAIHRQVGSICFLREVAALSDGSLGVDVQNQALVLIRQWADAFQGSDLQTFQDVYRQMKMENVTFPDVANDVPVFTPPSSLTVTVCAAGEPEETCAAGTLREQQLEKLQADLTLVHQKITLMRDLHTRGQTGEQLEDVVDFLRQCQPRMNTLIEGGVMGKIDEHTLEQCLNVNDNLMKNLEECGKTKIKDMMIFNSPPRASGLSQDVVELGLDEGEKVLFLDKTTADVFEESTETAKEHLAPKDGIKPVLYPDLH